MFDVSDLSSGTMDEVVIADLPEDFPAERFSRIFAQKIYDTNPDFPLSIWRKGRTDSDGNALRLVFSSVVDTHSTAGILKDAIDQVLAETGVPFRERHYFMQSDKAERFGEEMAAIGKTEPALRLQ